MPEKQHATWGELLRLLGRIAMEAKQSFLTPAREEDLEDLYKEVMGTGSANTHTEEKPFYLKAAETRSAKMEIPTQQLLATYSERLNSSSYPTPDRLTADEIQACVSGNLLMSDRIRHAESCEGSMHKHVDHQLRQFRA
jgi:hypothetical protein